MESSSPATLYATVVGAVLTIAGIIGFFYSASRVSRAVLRSTVSSIAAGSVLIVMVALAADGSSTPEPSAATPIV